MSRSRKTYSGTARRKPERRRGVVLLLVISTLAVAAVLAYSILAASALDAQSAAHARAAARAETMAESGVNLAMHYLLHPEDSPVPLVQGAGGDWHYPGQSDIAVDEDRFSVSVTNIAPAKYLIESAGYSRDADGNQCLRRLRVRLVGAGSWKALGAIQLAADLDLDADVLVDGNLVTSGKFEQGAGDVTGLILASNHAEHAADPAWGPPPALPELAVPPFAALDLVQAVSDRSGYYAYNNMRCRVDYIPTGPLLLPPVASPQNSGKVFVYVGSAPLILGGLTSQYFEGTLVVTQGNLVVEQDWRFQPQNGLPGLIVAGTTAINSGNGRLEVDGVYYNGGGFAASTTTDSNPVLVRGVMLCPVGTPLTLGANINGPLKFTFDAAKAGVSDLTDQGIRYSRLQIEDWEHVN